MYKKLEIFKRNSHVLGGLVAQTTTACFFINTFSQTGRLYFNFLKPEPNLFSSLPHPFRLGAPTCRSPVQRNLVKRNNKLFEHSIVHTCTQKVLQATNSSTRANILSIDSRKSVFFCYNKKENGTKKVERGQKQKQGQGP